MKYLKIQDNKAYYIKKVGEDEVFTEIDQINKDDLLYLLKQATSKDFELDELKEELLANKAHQIIYKNLSEKFADLLLNKNRFKDESENLYKEALAKYKAE